jgi:FkbM family methyltransferase
MLRPTYRVRHAGVFRSLAKICRNYLRWFGNASLRPEKNGERRLLRALAPAGIRTVIDVGANAGAWARAAAVAFPEATVHALEIVPATFETLQAAVASEARIRPVATGLSDRPGTLRIRWDPRFPTHATWTDYPYAWTGERAIDCPVTTGDEFLRARGIDRVDLLKIDVEGAEHLVLRGFAGALAARRVRFVQFEYGRFHVLTGFRLRDFHELLRAHGYVVGKIFPDYVELRDYDVADEDFFTGGNYFACPADDPFREGLARP